MPGLPDAVLRIAPTGRLVFDESVLTPAWMARAPRG
jgi:hypothetical protein